MKKNSKKIFISVIVPFYNEKARIVHSYEVLRSYLTTHHPQFQLIFVDDGSTDGGGAILQKHCVHDPRTQCIRYSKNRGRGYAVKHGFAQADGKYLCYIDADLDIGTQYISDCIAGLKHADIAVVSKHHADSYVNSPYFRKVASWAVSTWIGLVLGLPVSDTQAGLKVFKRSVISKIISLVHSEGWSFDIELLYAAYLHNFKIVEIPIQIEYGFGRIKPNLIRGFFAVILFVMLLRLRKNNYV